MYKVMKPNKAVLRKNRCRFLDYFTEEWNVCYSVWCSWASGEQGILLGCLNNLPVEIAAHSQPSTSFNEPSIGLSKFLNLLCTCPQYRCSEDLLDDRRGSIKFITPLDVSFGKSTKYWLSMTTGILTSSNLRNWNNTCVRNLQLYLSLQRTLLLAILKVTDARRDVIMARGLHRRFHLPPESIGGRSSGPSHYAFPLVAWYLHVLLDAMKTVWTSTVFRLLQIKKMSTL